MSSTTKIKHTLHNIQALRAFAALLVILHHALPHYEVMGGELSWIKAVSSWGFVGVDIFFVISGYIMAYTTFNKPRTYQSALIFLKHRLFRIYLGYWPFFVAMLVILYKKKQLAGLDLWGSFWLTNDNMFQLVLPVSWSLSYELYFYGLFSLTFFFSIPVLKRFFPLLSLFFVLLSLYLFLHPDLPQRFFYSHFLLEFFGGVILYIYRLKLMHLQLLPVIFLVATASYTLGIFYETQNGLLRIATFGTGALMIVWLALIIEYRHLWSSPQILITLGDTSYTLYLSHLIILELFYYSGLRDFFTSPHTIVSPLLGLLTILFLCIIFSLLYYHYIEKPVYRAALQRFS